MFVKSCAHDRTIALKAQSQTKQVAAKDKRTNMRIIRSKKVTGQSFGVILKTAVYLAYRFNIATAIHHSSVMASVNAVGMQFDDKNYISYHTVIEYQIAKVLLQYICKNMKA